MPSPQSTKIKVIVSLTSLIFSFLLNSCALSAGNEHIISEINKYLSSDFPNYKVLEKDQVDLEECGIELEQPGIAVDDFNIDGLIDYAFLARKVENETQIIKAFVLLTQDDNEQKKLGILSDEKTVGVKRKVDMFINTARLIRYCDKEVLNIDTGFEIFFCGRSSHIYRYDKKQQRFIDYMVGH